MAIPALDLIIIVVYLVGITAIGMLSVRRREVTGEVYFLAGRALPWSVVGAALYASNISAIHMVGLPGRRADESKSSCPEPIRPGGGTTCQVVWLPGPTMSFMEKEVNLRGAALRTSC